jgi:hypothetical protein
MSEKTACRARKADFRGWPACYLENEFITLVAVPDIGGRVMAYDLGPYPFLFVDPDLAGKLFSPEENMGDGSLAAWKNYGGDKTWPAPQGWETDEQWHGPPDPVLDTGRYKLSALEGDGGSALVRMDSPPDPRTGLQITRQCSIRPGSSRVQLVLSFRNIKEQPIRWSIWDVVQLRAERPLPGGGWTYDPACTVTTPLNPDSRFSKGFNVMFGEEKNPQWQADAEKGIFLAQYMWEIGKVGIDSPAGWIAFSNGNAGYAFAECFDYEPGGDYPDDGATVECWTVGAGVVANLNYADSGIYLMETEVLSPLRIIQPGQVTTFSIEWGACRCSGPIEDVRAAGCTAKPLGATKAGGQVQLTGQFGVFDAGDLLLAWKDGQGIDLGRQPLGPADPMADIYLDRVAQPPSGARKAELWLQALHDGEERLLAEVGM